MKSCSFPLEPSKTHGQFLHNHIETQSFFPSKTSYDLHHHQGDGKKNDLKCITSKTTTTLLQSNNGQQLPVPAGDDAIKVVRDHIQEPSSDCASSKALQDDCCGRERLKRHRIDAAGSVWIPDIWGQEELLKDWIDCSAFDASLVPNRIMSARAALVEQGRRATSCSGRLRIENRC
ncbi:hypothetical protein P3X46_009532 [Hevea brasiliensis]|uniref:Protein BIC1 n=1 Tax=Hevea brasiliensis TaxID=3981 RepID=A0ABQ9MM49_HEVBR|nr:uncharacterized protein LOC110634351 [Hevea brasiliensis]KAJ9181399.1 hypothetical protein P3X46_009532 [Hevea brasiliensis]